MKILIFGGSGFLGKNLALQLCKKHKVTIFDRKNFKISPKRNIKFIKGNILNFNQVLKATRKQEVIYNFAGISDIGEAMSQPILTTKVNILGSIYTLEAAIKCKVKRYIFASISNKSSIKISILYNSQTMQRNPTMMTIYKIIYNVWLTK